MSTEIGSFGWHNDHMANSRGNELVAARATVGLAGLKRLHPSDAHRHPVYEHVITLGVPRSINGLDSGLFCSFLGVFAGHRCERSVRRIPRVPGLQVSANPDPSKNRTPGQPTVQHGTVRPNTGQAHGSDHQPTASVTFASLTKRQREEEQIQSV
jgi:hypothetical protein